MGVSDGVKFENLVVNNLKTCVRFFIDLLKLPMQALLSKNNTAPEWMSNRSEIQTRHNLSLSRNQISASEIKRSVIEEMNKKTESISCPKNFSISPVLIHVNGVSQAVKESEAFTEIIDLSQFFNQIG
jgi:hypothetical protein